MYEYDCSCTQEGAPGQNLVKIGEVNYATPNVLVHYITQSSLMGLNNSGNGLIS